MDTNLSPDDLYELAYRFNCSHNHIKYLIQYEIPLDEAALKTAPLLSDSPPYAMEVFNSDTEELAALCYTTLSLALNPNTGDYHVRYN